MMMTTVINILKPLDQGAVRRKQVGEGHAWEPD